MQLHPRKNRKNFFNKKTLSSVEILDPIIAPTIPDDAIGITIFKSIIFSFADTIIADIDVGI